MKPEDFDQRRGSDAPSVVLQMRQFFGRTYECRIMLVPEDEGGFSAFATKLPGVVSQGDTESQAIENIKDAFRESLRAYLDMALTAPWNDVLVERRPGRIERLIIVDV